MTAQNEPADKGPEIDPATAAPASADAAAAASADPLLDLQAQLAAAQAKATEHYDQLLRTRAEAENIRRRAQEDVSKAHKFGIESFAESLVPVMDSLQAALAQPDQTLEALRAGVESTLKQLTSAFERNRLIQIEPAAGEKFDPHQHQAISSIPSEQPANTVVQTLQKGYLISDRVLRPALVMVSAGQG
ncbi:MULTISPECIES: nucleotide exchange factor GrpE [unclassified Achromobacter]|uniref:nucleotide exchange factor GrpE n=1 Tax=unclassified Achromobacter TaxID=2626865 RepID=UPI000B5160B0|nr:MULTISPECIES: nucleotide exchange factor GrpE [unclassified Achromobacter]OWT71580.1 nucleotide exchange factor GrpE [Achromobacter sp. HZ34]OWT73237.1 nucleotide exchange factor GrpE [Achromobacter sp. HZ28]